MNQIEQNPSLDKPISPTIFIFVKLMQQYAARYNGKMYALHCIVSYSLVSCNVFFNSHSNVLHWSCVFLLVYYKNRSSSKIVHCENTTLRKTARNPNIIEQSCSTNWLNCFHCSAVSCFNHYFHDRCHLSVSTQI